MHFLTEHLLSQNSLVLTPNQRLARHLQQKFAKEQCVRGAKTWETPKIYALDHWLSKCWNDCLNPRILLSDTQEQILWKKIIADSGFAPPILSAKIVNLVKAAWELIKQWQVDWKTIDSFTEETAKFKLWTDVFYKTCKTQNFIDKNSITEELITHIKNNALLLPKTIILTGFTEIKPQFKNYLDTLAQYQVKIEYLDLNVDNSAQYRIGFENEEQEILAMARWARQQLQNNPEISIGCIVPNLSTLRQTISDVFIKVFASEALLSQHIEITLPFNISLGKKLGEPAIINCAWQILQLGQKKISLEILGNLLHSPFIAGYQKEFAARAILETELTNLPISEIALSKIIRAEKYFKNCPGFKNCLAKYLKLAPKINAKQTTTTWAAVFSQQLQCFAWPAVKDVESIEYQLLQRFQKLLSEFANLNLILPKISYRKALQHLKTLLEQTIFQAKTKIAPINILGILEATGINFDRIWVMGMDNENWPPAPHPNPFLPINLQRKLTMPHASAERELTFCKQITAIIMHSATEIIYSYAKTCEERKLQLSPLIADGVIQEITEQQLKLAPYVDPAKKLYASQEIENFSETLIPIAENSKARGGSEILKSQALCPFQAFARHRLNLKPLYQPKITFLRGSLAHAALEYFWKDVQTQQNLQNYAEHELEELLQQCIALSFKNYGKGFFQKEFLALEQQCLTKLLQQWLNLEKARQPFMVVAVEKIVNTNLSGINIKLRIDRIDKLINDDKLIVIDYKTTKKLPSLSEWFDERITNPQLPLYSIITENVSGMIFAHLKIGSTKPLYGLSEIKITDDFKVTEDWQQLRNNWQTALENLARDFALGKAHLDPKDKNVCKWCNFVSLCRVKESTIVIIQRFHSKSSKKLGNFP